MKKYIIISLGLVLMLALVSAVTIGTTYTQSQVNNINVTGFDLGEKFIRDHNNKIIVNCEEGICKVGTTMISVDPEMILNETNNQTYHSGNYVIVDRIGYVRFDKNYWANIRDETNETYATKELKKKLLKRREFLVHKERTYLKSLQDYIDVDLSDVIDNLE